MRRQTILQNCKKATARDCTACNTTRSQLPHKQAVRTFHWSMRTFLLAPLFLSLRMSLG